MRKLNIACGDRYHGDWINIDFYSSSKNVIKVNILAGLPFENNSIDIIYSSHFLEHLSQKQADFVLMECERVLKKNGILRLVVPDLENICQEYLRVLDSVTKNECHVDEYHWVTVELLDQLVRVNSGGEMGEIFNQVVSDRNKNLAKYVSHRIGVELFSENDKSKTTKLTYDEVKTKALYLYLKLIRILIPKNIRELVFVNTSVGEKHQWMYDKFSLKKKIAQAGFRNIKQKNYDESDISNFNNYLLDIKKDRSPYKGVSSLYIEAAK